MSPKTATRELLVEIGCEEMPASWLPSLTRQFGECVTTQLDEARLAWNAPVRAFSTPRRLAVQIANVAGRQSDREEDITGPPVTAAFDADGRPLPAALGFARKLGVDISVLDRRDTPKGEYLAYRRTERGKTARSVLADVLSAVLRALSFPKKMHWDAWLDDGHGDFLFGRPIRWVVFLYGGTVVPFVIRRTAVASADRVVEVSSGAVTFGHRFFSRKGKPGRPIRARSFADYQKGLATNFVLIDRDDRRARIERKLASCAQNVGGRVALSEVEGSLLNEVPDLVEYPSVVTGTFPSEFLNLPVEVLKTTMIHHQHYFPVVGRSGALQPHFLAVTNTPRDNVARIARNAERVLVARLRDARFFWDADRKRRLEDRLLRLETLRFHHQLGSYGAKAKRISRLAERIAREVLSANPGEARHAGRAGLLCKADLATDMVGEFPELQGVMGGVYSREDGDAEVVWKAVYHHYLPVGIGADDPPFRQDLGDATLSWAAVSLADKLDTVVGLFQVGEKPTGSRDPFGIRRQAQGLIRTLVDLPELTGCGARVTVGQLFEMAYEHHGQPDRKTADRTTTFMLERLRYVLEERGFDVRNVRSVTQHASLLDVRPLDARRKLEVLPEFTDSPDFRQLATLFKRVKNIARELPESATPMVEDDSSLVPLLNEPAESALLDDIKRRRSVIDSAVQTGHDYRAAFAEAAKFASAVDRFFTEVFVMVDDAEVRQARLCLMKRLELLLSRLADISEIVPKDEFP